MLPGMINLTIGKWMDKIALEHPDNLAVKTSDNKFNMTYKEFNSHCNNFAKGLLSIGIKPGDHVAIWATNYPEWLITLFGSVRIGAVLVTVNTSYKVFEAEYLLRQSDTKALVMIDGFKDSNYIEIINELCPELKDSKPGELDCLRLPCLKHVIFVGENTPDGMYDFNDLFEIGKAVTDEELYEISDSLDCHDVVNMQYTSGTTGFPKGVMLTHYNILNNGNAIGGRMKFTPKDKLCLVVPLFHCFGLVLATMASITHASGIVLVDAFQPKKVLDTVQNEKCTALHGVPTMFIAMLEHPDFKDYKLNLRTGIMAGSPCPIKVMQDVVDRMGMSEITIVYGQTEASPGCTQTTTDDPLELRVATVGRKYDNIETKIVDPETGEELGPHQPGEFCVRGYNIMKGYYKMPEATAQVIDKDGWLHTGDIAIVDENGYYKITGRLKDMIIRGGENIYPKEIEDFLYTHEAVSDVQVIGVPSKDYGEEILAYIILKKGCSATQDDIKQYVKSKMARHKTPKHVVFVDSFPMTASGKIQKFKLREKAIELFDLQQDASIETA